ncbi:hypothetical protein Agub_g13817 [Astrephomene gubernaculifera]|uniref:TF-B3 domain-containing protein n=1 Tax=Astrephomene gubernaculifera TaxID=47775 RepID=A0AAD3E2N7_9CHLO|nr:hypothetical protein Agub_g13817 [Astrephomene gubernaculifera]
MESLTADAADGQQGLASGLPLGLLSLPPEANAAAPFSPLSLSGLPMDPSAALLLSGVTAPRPAGQPHSQSQPQPNLLSNPAALAAALVARQGAPQPPGPGPGSGSVGVKAEPAPAAAAPASPADPASSESAAAALSARMAAVGAAIIFEKALTASDVSGGGRVVVPKSIAEQYFPRLEQPSGVTISASDLDGRGYTFKWRFWVNNSSRMYLLEGAGELHRNYGLEVGDVMVFAQKPDGSLVVAGRSGNKSCLLTPALPLP